MTRNLAYSTNILVIVQSVPGIPTRDQAVDYILRFAEHALASGDAVKAREVFLDVLILDPENAIARRGLETLPAPVTPAQQARLVIPVERLAMLPLSPAEASVVSRLAAGEMPVWRLLERCDRWANEVLEAMDRLVARRIVAVQDWHGPQPHPPSLM